MSRERFRIDFRRPFIAWPHRRARCRAASPEGSKPLTSTRRFEVRLATRDGRRVLTAQAEREVALMAEAMMRRYGDDILDVGFSVAAPDPAASRRIALYLSMLVNELDPA
jgi:hypothetical protein